MSDTIREVPEEQPRRKAHELTTTVIRKTERRVAHVFTDLEPQDRDDQHGGPTFGWSPDGGGAA